MLRVGLRTPHCYRETSGLGCATERECGSRAAWCRPDTEDPLTRVYIIDADGLIVSPEPPAEPGENEIVVASNQELRAARLSGKRLLTLWNGLPGVDRLSKVGDRGIRRSLVGGIGGSARSAASTGLEAARGDSTATPARGRHHRRGRAATGWQPHTVRGVFSGALKKKLGLAIVATKEERGRIYRVAEQTGA